MLPIKSVLLLLGLALSSGCLEVPKPAAASALDVRDVVASDGLAIQTACTPTGVELCFDALDNNCNGIIDEGCGVHTGILQFTIAWQEASVDIDLNVSGPDGKIASGDQATEAGLLKDRDCPGVTKSCYGQNVENVFLTEGRPLAGRYRVVVRLEDLRGVEPPIKVNLSTRIGQRHFSSSLALTKSSQQHAFEFTL